MPRILDPAMDAAILERHTDADYLVEIALDPSMYLSTAGQVDWSGNTWLAAGIGVSFSEAWIPTIAFPNHQKAGSGLFLNNVLRDVQVFIYSWYAPNAREIYRGWLSPARTDYRFAYFTAESTRSDRAVVPRRRIIYPTFTQLPVPGTEIRWQDTVVKVGR